MARASGCSSSSTSSRTRIGSRPRTGTSNAERSTGVEYDQKVTKAAIEEFEDILDNNPDADLSDNAKKRIQQLREKEAENNFLIAKFYEKQKNFKSAKIYYQIVVDQYNDSEFAKKALKRIQNIVTEN